MKIILVGASGTVGRAVYATLSKEHEVIGVSRSTDISVDIGDRKSIENMYKKIGSFDALVSTTGSVAFKTFEEFTDDSFGLGLNKPDNVDPAIIMIIQDRGGAHWAIGGV